jgi:uncharacterized protein
MTGRPSTTGSRHQPEAADSSYFAAFAPARYMLNTTFKPAGTPVSAPVQGGLDGGRAYFRAWSRSGTARRLRHTPLVQVAPCTVLGLYSSAPPRYATARLLTGQEAARAGRKLARKHPVQQRFLIRLLHRTRRWQMEYYELLAHEVTAG